MRQRIDLPRLYADASYAARESTDTSAPPRPLPETCPFALPELLANHPDIGTLVTRLS